MGLEKVVAEAEETVPELEEEENFRSKVGCRVSPEFQPPCSISLPLDDCFDSYPSVVIACFSKEEPGGTAGTAAGELSREDW